MCSDACDYCAPGLRCRLRARETLHKGYVTIVETLAQARLSGTGTPRKRCKPVQTCSEVAAICGMQAEAAVGAETPTAEQADDHTEAYAAQLHFDEAPGVLYHWRQQFAGSAPAIRAPVLRSAVQCLA